VFGSEARAVKSPATTKPVERHFRGEQRLACSGKLSATLELRPSLVWEELNLKEHEFSDRPCPGAVHQSHAGQPPLLLVALGDPRLWR